MPLVPKEMVDRIAGIFMPEARRQRDRFEKSSRQLVHYTTGENALRIISDQKILLRSTVCMNDYSEVRHGKEVLMKCLHKNEGRQLSQFRSAINDFAPGTMDQAYNAFEEFINRTINNVYISCLAEHDPDADKMGKLSMWRAYGSGATGVAIVIKKTPLFSNPQNVGFFCKPSILHDR